MQEQNTYKQPYYSIYSRIYCSGIITVNDVPAAERFGKQTEGQGGLVGSDAINHLVLQSGTFKVEGTMYPRYGNTTLTNRDAMEIDFDIAEANSENWKASLKKIHHPIISPWNGGTEGINYPSYKIGTELEVELPFVLDGWQNSLDLKQMDQKELFKEVLAYYRQIHAVLKEHNASKYLEMSKEKMTLMNQAYYKTEKNKQRFLDSAFELFGQEYEVEPLVEENLKMEIWGYGKLVRLMTKDHEQPLQFKSPDPEKQGNVKMEVKLHMRSKDKGFSII